MNSGRFNKIFNKTEKIYDKSRSLADFDCPDLYDRLVRVNQGIDQRLFSTMTFMVQMITQISSILIYLLDCQLRLICQLAFDAHAGYNIYKQFSDIPVGKTVIIVSHRLGSARLAI